MYHPPTRLTSVEELEAALKAVVNVEVTQSESGRGTFSIHSATIGDCFIYGGSGNRAMVLSGQRSTAFWTLTPITSRSAHGRYRGQALENGDLLFLNPGGEIFQQTHGGHHQQAVSISVPLAERIIGSEHAMTPESVMQHWARQKAPSASQQLDQLLTQLLSERTSPWAGRENSDQNLAGYIIATALSGGAPRPLRSSLANRRRIVSQAEDLIRSRLHQPPSVTELCEGTYSSRRLLFYAFHELLGRSPITHARILRLHAARQKIKTSTHKTTIQIIAAELGFSHAGQFAIDYFRLFGESPSQTRR
ncbi:helix-turn-helix domain-containing protein [Spiribacter sp. C176]|uniref:Helix-turn-helix domain-containing protein n=1 Tax=Spiribacter salilacus TaxID=2664894 RepID=A0A6N7QP61_9GAMM|nr:helix-turn-helix domain-containing protein [Spiribacter salilacus]MRH78196.1 helix-turn-helix domain-containing protein [Spiribacter salilacus]